MWRTLGEVHRCRVRRWVNHTRILRTKIHTIFYAGKGAFTREFNRASLPLPHTRRRITMSRKLTATILSAVVIAGGLFIAPASAAKISNGTACSKLNARITVSGYKYQCAKNSMVKNSKLTWLSVECVTAITQYQAAIKAQKSVGNIEAQTAELDAELEKAVAALASVTTAYENARAQVTKSQASMNASTVPAEKQALATALSKLANAVLILSSSKSKLSTQVKDLESKKALLLSAPAAFKDSVTDAQSSAGLLCKKGY